MTTVTFKVGATEQLKGTIPSRDAATVASVGSAVNVTREEKGEPDPWAIYAHPLTRASSTYFRDPSYNPYMAEPRKVVAYSLVIEGPVDTFPAKVGGTSTDPSVAQGGSPSTPSVASSPKVQAHYFFYKPANKSLEAALNACERAGMEPSVGYAMPPYIHTYIHTT